MTTRAEIIAEARTWLRTPWRHQASLKGIGTDCIGLIVGVARALGIAEAAGFDASAEIRGYGREPDPAMILRACSAFLAPCADPQPGDILLMRFTEPQHFGLVSAPGYMIHAYAQARKVVENRIDEVWRGRIVRAFSYRGIGSAGPRYRAAAPVPQIDAIKTSYAVIDAGSGTSAPSGACR